MRKQLFEIRRPIGGRHIYVAKSDSPKFFRQFEPSGIDSNSAKTIGKPKKKSAFRLDGRNC